MIVGSKGGSGFTLIELLIAVVLVSMLMLTGYYAYSVIVSSWQSKVERFDAGLDQVRTTRLLESALTGVMPWVIRRSSDQQPVFFFVGGEDRLLGVTRNGVFSQDWPEIFRLSVITDSEQKLRLVYQAVSTKDTLLLTSDQELVFTHRLVIATALEAVAFQYFGWESLEERNRSAPMIWQDAFSGLDRQLIPYRIKLAWTEEGSEEQTLEVELPYDLSRYLVPYFEDVL